MAADTFDFKTAPASVNYVAESSPFSNHHHHHYDGADDQLDFSTLQPCAKVSPLGARGAQTDISMLLAPFGHGTALQSAAGEARSARAERTRTTGTRAHLPNSSLFIDYLIYRDFGRLFLTLSDHHFFVREGVGSPARAGNSTSQASVVATAASVTLAGSFAERAAILRAELIASASAAASATATRDGRERGTDAHTAEDIMDGSWRPDGKAEKAVGSAVARIKKQFDKVGGLPERHYAWYNGLGMNDSSRHVLVTLAWINYMRVYYGSGRMTQTKVQSTDLSVMEQAALELLEGKLASVIVRNVRRSATSIVSAGLF
jgi:hypothetical protein